MEDKAPSTPRTDGALEEGKQQGSPRGGLGHAQQGCLFFSRLVLEVWRRVRLEVVVEWPLLKQRWKVLLFGIVMQYVHGIFTQLAHRMHQPKEQPLHDVGFDLTPELGPDKHWVSETIFGLAFATFVLWTFSPFVSQRKRFYTVVMWTRLLMVLVVCQALRIVTFSVTQLPGPSFHCRANEPTARRPWPSHWTGHLVVDVGRQVSKSCGDLIFSSHTTFMLTGILAYNEYGSVLVIKATSWLLGVILSILIIASRKHYTVDVVIAWYTVPLVFYTMYRRWTTRRPMSDFIGGPVLSAFDDVDGTELELEEVFIDRGTCGSGALFGCIDGGAVATSKTAPRPNTLKISLHAPVGVSNHHVLMGPGGVYGSFLGNEVESVTGSKFCDVQGRTQSSSGIPAAVMRGMARPAGESTDTRASQQQPRQQQAGQQLEDGLRTHGIGLHILTSWQMPSS
ncbi:hypothetical protein Vretimale_19969 [Volvox reticuliferus]|uniref:Sphingomyelin synthase-like domain-containing protein n=1 Tax=Volvox reticuliferus TaxID=1737510 RepID=A0A8J4H031_9CHLO|nr:hypothetical protein [Volvox reticuliferus]GIM17430.1 hypothetical protein Vretimale_19969 [Volvox reticuliferus]GIM17431.1 hypothetical protein Vretimale_19969 [Volvox reticuliferus]GIM17433.1 hypothetical protein Vretimale_19969 [Volvox reticuliferus]